VLGTAAIMVWCGLTSVGVGVSDIEKRCNVHRMSGNAFCIFGVGRYTCIFGCTDAKYLPGSIGDSSIEILFQDDMGFFGCS
jgi:hypothetical protein